MSLFGPDDELPRQRKPRGAPPAPPRPPPPAAPMSRPSLTPEAPTAPPAPATAPARPSAPPTSTTSLPAIVIPDADDAAALRAWLRRQLAGETPLQVQGEPGVRPWRGVPVAWAVHPEHGAFVRSHLDVVRGVVDGAPLPPWLRSRWLEHLASLEYASRSRRGRRHLSAAELEAAERHDEGA